MLKINISQPLIERHYTHLSVQVTAVNNRFLLLGMAQSPIRIRWHALFKKHVLNRDILYHTTYCFTCQTSKQMLMYMTVSNGSSIYKPRLAHEWQPLKTTCYTIYSTVCTYSVLYMYKTTLWWPEQKQGWQRPRTGENWTLKQKMFMGKGNWETEIKKRRKKLLTAELAEGTKTQRC